MIKLGMNVDANAKKIVNLADPVNEQDAVNLRTLNGTFGGQLKLQLAGTVTFENTSGSQSKKLYTNIEYLNNCVGIKVKVTYSGTQEINLGLTGFFNEEIVGDTTQLFSLDLRYFSPVPITYTYYSKNLTATRAVDENYYTLLCPTHSGLDLGIPFSNTNNLAYIQISCTAKEPSNVNVSVYYILGG